MNMRPTFVCILLALIIQKDGLADGDDFIPTPIPLDNWSGENLESAGTLHEFIKTDAPPTVAAIPAHYWEDALRHSVYLTLVRDKIDQLIAKGTVISPDSKPKDNISKEVDDHDLWEKIKAAPFDRVKEEPLPPSDVVILAKGRLLEERNGFRFAEGDEKCDRNNCTQPVKAYWSVKRIRQNEISPGKYHYELTFSVSSQTPRKIRKLYENPARTFTIRENSPTERPPIPISYPYRRHSDRSQRAIWFHKNIASHQNYQNRLTSSHGLDRIFSSLFSDDENYDEATYRRKPNVPYAYTQQTAKVGYVNDREQYIQKKMIPYPIKPPSFRYNHPPIPPPPISFMQYPHLDLEQGGFNPHTTLHQDSRYIPPNHIKTTKQVFLPTPITNFQLLKESTIDVPIKTILNATDYTTKKPEFITTTTSYKIHSNKQPPTKMSYFPESIRPPVYNAPPGVFVTMDKKPFKPMPPLKLKHSSKPYKNVPLDFRPSPQILDTSYTDTDSADGAFRPIMLNLTEFLNSKKGPKNNRKPTTSKKPSKKHGNIKTQRLTTISPEIITAQSMPGEDELEIQWAEILSALTKTTPMASQKEKYFFSENDITTTTNSPTTITETHEESATTQRSKTISSSTTTTTTTTTPKTKRTRPPPKFTKPDIIKKHRRITSTTTSTTTAKTTPKYPTKKPTDDLTPQASSAATSAVVEEPKHEEDFANTTTTSTTANVSAAIITTPRTILATTTIKISTAPTISSSSLDSNTIFVTTQPKSRNRFRQSALMQKGTSVNHDKWSITSFEKNRTVTTSSSIYPFRRKASKFQGYITSTTPRQKEVERNREDHVDRASSSSREIISSTQQPVDGVVKITHTPQQTLEKDSETINNSVPDSDIEHDIIEIDIENEDAKDIHSKDHNEYIFQVTSPIPDDYSSTLAKQSKTEHNNIVASTLLSITKNNTKCKKKKHENFTVTEDLKSPIETTTISTSTSSTTDTVTTPHIFDELFEGFTLDDFIDKQNVSPSTTAPGSSESESSKHEQYIPIDDDIEDFLHSQNIFEVQKSNEAGNDEKYDQEYEEENDDEDSPFNNQEDNLDSRQFNGEYYDDSSEIHKEESEHRPYSLLELMAME